MKKVIVYKMNNEVEEVVGFISKVETTNVFLIVYFEDGSETNYILSNIYKFDYISN